MDDHLTVVPGVSGSHRRAAPGAVPLSASQPSKLALKLSAKLLRARQDRSHLSSIGPRNLWDYEPDEALRKSFSQPLLPPQNEAPNASSKRRQQRAQAKSEQADRNRLLATSGDYLKQAQDGVWLSVGKLETALERPATRREIVQLERRFESAVLLSSQSIRRTAAKSSEAFESMMEQDVVNTREHVRLLFSSSGGFTGALDGDKGAARLSEHQEALAAVLFEQKWADLTLGEVQAQVMVSCLEHGKLLHKLRMRLAANFEELRATHAHTIEELGERNMDCARLEERALGMGRRLEQLKEELALEHGLELERTLEEAKTRYDGYEGRLEEAQHTQQRMADTLTTLNGIFRGMREDSDAVRAMDLRDACNKLETKLSEALDEVEELRPLKRQLKEMTQKCASQASRIEDLSATISRLSGEVGQREALVEDLAQRESNRLTEIELKLLQNGGSGLVPEIARQSATSVTDASLPKANESPSDAKGSEGISNTDATVALSGARDGPPQTKGSKRKALVGNAIADRADTVKVPSLSEWASAPTPTAAAQIRAGMDGPNSSATVMCSRCNAALDAAGNIDDLVSNNEGSHGSASHNGATRLACAAYRSLLPNLMGYRPERPRTWVVRVMRCLVQSKRRDDFLADRIGRPRIRFPEWVYAWFTPKPEDTRSMDTEKRKVADAEADENRWGLYYGVKILAKELPEARLFWTFLDEKYGEDDLAFYLHTITVIEGVASAAGAELEWGPLTNIGDYTSVVQLLDEMGDQEVPEFVFIEVRYAAEAVKRVMSRAGDEEQTKALQLLAESAVASEGRISTSSTGNKMIDVSVVIRVLLQEYREEQARRRAAVRLMFRTATAGVSDQDTNKSVDLGQLGAIVTTLNPSAQPLDAVTLFRNASEIGKGKVGYEVFADVAERASFFSRCLRLDTHFGTEHASGLTKVQLAQLGDVVRKHAALVGILISDSTTNLDALQRRRLETLYDDLQRELNKGGVTLDGRRPLVALRRVLELLLNARLVATELQGDAEILAKPENAINAVDVELTAFATVIRGGEADDRTRNLGKIQESNASSVIQRKWRQKRDKAPPIGVPPVVRNLLSAGFDPYIRTESPSRRRASSDGEADDNGDSEDDKSMGEVVKVSVRLPRAPKRPIEWLLLWIDEIYRTKLTLDTHIATSMLTATTVTQGGSKGKNLKRAPKGNDTAPLYVPPRFDGMPVEVAIVHTAFGRFGVRSIAERWCHDFFVSVHAHAKTNPRVRLLARFLNMRTMALMPRRKSVMDPTDDKPLDLGANPLIALLPKELSSPAAVATYFAALSILHQGSSNGKGALFSKPDSDGVSWVSTENAVQMIKAVFKGATGTARHTPCGSHPAKQVFEEAIGLVANIEHRGKVDADRLLLVVMQSWHAELTQRIKLVDAIAAAGSLDKIHDLTTFEKEVRGILGARDLAMF